MIITLIFTACTISQPPQCRQERFDITGGQIAMQAALAEWCEGHPGWRVVAWRAGR